MTNDKVDAGRLIARRRFGAPAADPQAAPLTALPRTKINVGKLNAIAKHHPEPARRREAAAVLRRWRAPILAGGPDDD